MIEFNSLFEYLFLLRGVAESLACHGPNVMLYLAAAVSDFYIPSQSRVCIFCFLMSWAKMRFRSKLIFRLAICQKGFFRN